MNAVKIFNIEESLNEKGIYNIFLEYQNVKIQLRYSEMIQQFNEPLFVKQELDKDLMMILIQDTELKLKKEVDRKMRYKKIKNKLRKRL